MDAHAWITDNFESTLEDLKDYLRIPSISTLDNHQSDMLLAAQWTEKQLQQIGMTNTTIVPTQGHPIVYGEWLNAENAPTVIIYGHYDVQPPDPLDAWDNDPFDPVLRNESIVARGAADDKGMVFINLKAIEALMQTNDGQLPINVRFIIEGEEEISSQGLKEFVKNETTRARADVVVISDSTMLSLEQPAISVAFRGGVYIELEVRGPAFDLHSGQHGGVVHNPAQALCEIIAALHNPDGSVNIPGFYDHVQALDPIEKAELDALYSEEEFQAETGAPHSWGEASYNLRERIVGRPTLEVCGIFGGWTGDGRKTVIPSKAIAKISCRLVADQDPDEIEELLRARIQELTPKTVTSEVRSLGKSNPVTLPTNNPAFVAASKAYKRGFGVDPIFMKKGGSLPIISTFRDVMDVPVILAGYGLPSDRVHGPNEKFDLACLRRGMHTAAQLYTELGEYTPEELKE